MDLFVKHIERLDCPNEQLVASELVAEAIQAGHLALLVALVLWQAERVVRISMLLLMMIIIMIEIAFPLALILCKQRYGN